MDAVRDRLHAAGDDFREVVDGVLVQVDLGQVDELELLLLGQEPREVALADPAARQHDLAEAAVGLLRLDQRVAHGQGARCRRARSGFPEAGPCRFIGRFQDGA